MIKTSNAVDKRILDKSRARYIVGIDLGTTHCVVTYCDIKETGLQGDDDGTNAYNIQLFEIEQLVGPGEIARRPYLPSFRYHPAKDEMSMTECFLPWGENDSNGAIVGEWARELNSKVDGRGVVSAKSWLSHSTVDRHAPILPWSGAEGVLKVSPVSASASYLLHIRGAWDHYFPEDPLAQQEIVITIPASFDEVARALTVESAKEAGLMDIRLLEEPQAVVYDWLYRHNNDAAVKLKDTKLILVCDLGGGTTDLSLISVTVEGDEVNLARVAVGDHLMLGGDNIDLAIAYQAERQVTKGGKKLTASALSQLVQQSRKAKEQLLSKDAPDHVTITVLGSGSKLIGGTRQTQVAKSEIHQMVLDGFFPITGFNELPKQRVSGVVEIGLNYVSDPAVSKHIASFLKRHQLACHSALRDQNSIQEDDDLENSNPAIPDAILFNGGMFKSPLIIERVLSLFKRWSPNNLTVLDNDRSDQAVAYGASAYGLARRGWQAKIEGGSARSYFLLVDNHKAKRMALCVLPKGAAEAEFVALRGKTFSLKLGQPVSFNLVSTVADKVYSAGELISVDEDQFIALPPLVTVLTSAVGSGGSSGDKKEIEVELVANMTPVGTLQVQCVAIRKGQVWELEFESRVPASALEADDVVAALPKGVQEALIKISEVYGKSDKQVDTKTVKNLRPNLEKILGKKADWNTAVLRALATEIVAGAKRRRRSNSHERLWNNLMGYCLRPGFGYPLDEWKVNALWDYYQQGVQFSGESQSWAEWWTLWRRVAGGLSEEAQKRIYKDIAKFINPGTARNQKVAQNLKTHSYEDMVRLAAVLEHLPVESKVELGGWLVKRLQKTKEPEASWWALGRVGSRVPFHGSAHRVVPKKVAHQWVEILLKQDWIKNKSAALAASMIARQSGDRERDLDESLRETVVKKLLDSKCSSSWVDMVEQVVQLDAKDQQRVFGESLPAGLRLIE